MKVAHLITSLKIGGAESVLCALLSNVDPKQHLVIYFHFGPNVERLHNMGITTYQIKGLFSPYDPIGIICLFRLLKHLKPDLIHSALWSANILGSIFSKILKIPIICDLHGDVIDHGSFRNFFERVTVNIPKRFIAVSRSVQLSFNDNIGTGLVSVITNGIDSDHVIEMANANKLTRADIGLLKDDFIIGSVGRLAAIKCYDVLINAFALFSLRAKNAKLCIVGDGPERSNLEGLVSRLGLRNSVIFLGERSDAVSIYPLFNCFTLASFSEGLSIALLEAMCFGLPIITTSKSLDHDVIEDGVNGFLVPVHGIEPLSIAIANLYDNPGLVVRIKKRNIEDVRTKFNVKKMHVMYEQIYRDIVGDKV